MSKTITDDLRVFTLREVCERLNLSPRGVQRYSIPASLKPLFAVAERKVKND